MANVGPDSGDAPTNRYTARFTHALSTRASPMYNAVFAAESKRGYGAALLRLTAYHTQRGSPLYKICITK